MIISDLNHLETASEENNLVGGLFNANLGSANLQTNVAIVGQRAAAVAVGLIAVANAANLAFVGQNSTNA